LDLIHYLRAFVWLYNYCWFHRIYLWYPSAYCWMSYLYLEYEIWWYLRMRALLMSDWSQIWLTRWNWLSLIRSRVAIPLLKRWFSHVFQALSKPAKSRTHTRSCLKTVSTSFPCYSNRMRSNLDKGRCPDKENKKIKVIPQKLHLKFVIVHVWRIKLIKLFQRQVFFNIFEQSNPFPNPKLQLTFWLPTWTVCLISEPNSHFCRPGNL